LSRLARASHHAQLRRDRQPFRPGSRRGLVAASGARFTLEPTRSPDSSVITVIAPRAISSSAGLAHADGKGRCAVAGDQVIGDPDASATEDPANDVATSILLDLL